MRSLSEAYVARESLGLEFIRLGEVMDRIMKRFAMLVLLAILSVSSVGVEARAGSFMGKTVVASASLINKGNDLVVGVKNGLLGANRLADVVARFGGRIINKVTLGGEPLAILVNVPSNNISSFESEAQTFGLAKYFEPNVEFNAQFVPSDPFWSSQWGPQKIEADWAWNTTIGNKSILVAVVDTGIDYNHPDIAANYNASGFDWVNNDANPMDDNGHGTHCAGIIAAVTNNSLGIAGMAQVQIMAEKGLDANGTGYEDNLASAIYDAVEKGARILSLSWGSDQDSQLIHEAIQYAYSQNVLIVGAGGNQAFDTKFYPAAYDEVIAVTATDQFDYPAFFSNYGSWIELSAPGVQILSTFPNDSYKQMDGTSMACPHVAGLGALVWSQFPNATRDWVRAQMRYTADDLGSPGFDPFYGYGRINARRAVEQVPPVHDVLILDWESPNSIAPGDIVYFNLTVLNFGSSDEQDVTAELFVNSNVQFTSIHLGVLPAGSSWTTDLIWNPQVEGIFNVTLYVVPVLGEAKIGNNEVSEEILVQQMLSLNPSEGPAGTRVVVTGVSFSPSSQVMLTFNDALVGFIVTDALGSFDFTFNVPFSSAGTQVVKAVDSAGINASSEFTVVDTTPLSVQIDVGSILFIHETAIFYVQTTFKGEAVDATVTDVTLYKPDGAFENLVAEQVSTGLYKVPYTLVTNETGTYTLVAEASYIANTIQANGTSFKSFLVSSTLTLMDQSVVGMDGSIASIQTDLGLIDVNLTAIYAQVINVTDRVANVQTDLGLIKINLASINATVDSIFLNVEAINGDVATIETTIGTMNGTITAMNGNVATILVPGVGQIKADVSGFKVTREVWTLTQYLILAIAAVAAAGAILTLLTLRRRKKPETTANPEAPPQVPS
jgi:thermitase